MMLVLNFSSCSWKKAPSAGETEVMTTFSNRWMSADSKHSLVDSEAEAIPHIFFDTTPEFKMENRLVNAIVTTPKDSENSYSIDLNSGQRYYSHSYCKQEDIWKKYNRSINRPSFSVGFMPRVLDQIGDPQKIIIFSQRNDFAVAVETNYYQVKLIGAYVEQICPDGNCLGKDNWLSRLVFVGIDAQDKSIAHINDVYDLQKVFSWTEAKAEIENIDGRNSIGDLQYPTTKVGLLIKYEDAFPYFKKRSIFFTDQELKKVQKGCHVLYNSLWEEVGKTHPEDLPATNQEELNKKRQLISKLQKEKYPVGFGARFRAFTRKYFNEISTCEKFVYHGNVNGDREAFWFLSYVGIFYRLHREGYYFDCSSRAWQRNVLDAEGKPVHDIKRDIRLCKEKEIDQAMEYLPNFLTGLKAEKEYFRFIDYDNLPTGTHNKMYSWVKVNSRRLGCDEDPNIKIRNTIKVFPEDISWKARAVKDYFDGTKTIE